MSLIFLLEDDLTLANGIKMVLSDSKTDIVINNNIADAKITLSKNTFDLLILDVNLPDGSGIDLLKEQKKLNPSLPVILLTANDMEIDIVSGLESGADDYITKPFSLAILRARINAQLRRNKTQYIEIDNYKFDFENMIYSKNQTNIELSKTEQKLLKILIENRGHNISRAVLVDKIWTDGFEYVDENALTVTIKRLRNKLEDKPSEPKYIKTVYGIGYTWAVK